MKFQTQYTETAYDGRSKTVFIIKKSLPCQKLERNYRDGFVWKMLYHMGILLQYRLLKNGGQRWRLKKFFYTIKNFQFLASFWYIIWPSSCRNRWAVSLFVWSLQMDNPVTFVRRTFVKRTQQWQMKPYVTLIYVWADQSVLLHILIFIQVK